MVCAQCICEICTCGRHHCPNPKHEGIQLGDKSAAVTSSSEYRKEFASKPVERTPVKKRAREESGIFSHQDSSGVYAQSRYKEEFQQRSIEKPLAKKPKDAWTPKSDRPASGVKTAARSATAGAVTATSAAATATLAAGAVTGAAVTHGTQTRYQQGSSVDSGSSVDMLSTPTGRSQNVRVVSGKFTKEKRNQESGSPLQQLNNQTAASRNRSFQKAGGRNASQIVFGGDSPFQPATGRASDDSRLPPISESNLVSRRKDTQSQKDLTEIDNFAVRKREVLSASPTNIRGSRKLQISKQGQDEIIFGEGGGDVIVRSDTQTITQQPLPAIDKNGKAVSFAHTTESYQTASGAAGRGYGDGRPASAGDTTHKIGHSDRASTSREDVSESDRVISKVKPKIPKDQYPLDRDGKFDDSTISRTEYTGGKGDRYDAKRPQSSIRLEGGGIDSKTTSQNDYAGQRASKAKPVVPADQYMPDKGGDHDYRTTSNQEFAQKRGDAFPAKRPVDNEILLKENFTQDRADDYATYSGERVHPKKPQDQYPLERNTAFDSTTMHQRDYQGGKGDRHDPKRPASTLQLAGGDFNDVTTAKTEYAGYSPSKEAAIIPQDQYPVDHSGRVNYETTKKHEYTGARGDRYPAHKPQDHDLMPHGKFQAAATADLDYTYHRGERSEVIIPQDQYPVDHDSRMRFETTKKHEYHYAKGDHYPAHRPEDHDFMMKGDFENRTVANEDYQFIAGERVEKRVPSDQYPVAHGDAFDSRTMNTQEYQGLKGDRYSAKVPQSTLKLGGDSFTDETTAKTEYQGNRGSRQSAKVPDDQYPVDRSAERTFDTTKSLEYQGLKGDRYAAAKPVDHDLMPRGSFHSETVARQDYQIGHADRAEKRVPSDQYPVDRDATFDSTTMNREQYQGGAGERYAAVRPASTLRLGGDGYTESATTAHEDFSGHRGSRTTKVVPKDQYPVDHEARMEFETTNTDEHQRVVADRYPTHRPKDNIEIASGAFDSRTVANADYQFGTGDRVERIVPKDQYPVDHGGGAFESTTMNLQEYQGLRGDRYQKKVPESSLKVGEGSFVDETTAGAEYQGYRVYRESANVPQDQYPVERSGEQTFDTTKSQEYQGLRGDRYAAKKPVDSELMPKGDFDSRTIAQQDFQTGKVERSEKQIPKDQYPVDRDAAFDSTTMNKEQYSGAAGERYQVRKPESTLKVGDGTFDASTTAQNDFQGYRGSKTSKIVPQDQYPVDHGAQMFTETTKDQEHSNTVGDRYPLTRPQDNIGLASGSFEGRTVANEDYQFGVAERAERRIPKDQYPVAADGTFDAQTMHAQEYRQVKGDRYKAKVPESSLQVGQGEFMDTTTAGDEYRGYRITREGAKVPQDQYPVDRSAQQNFQTTNEQEQQYMKGERYAAKRPEDHDLMPRGQFDSTTMNQEQYRGAAGDRYQVKRPESNLKMGDGTFDSSTTAQQDFQGYQTSKAKKIIPKDQYPVDHDAKMTYETTKIEEHADLVGERYPARRPEDNIALASGAFEGRTVANEDYKFGVGERTERIVPKDQYPVAHNAAFDHKTMNLEEYTGQKGDRYMKKVPTDTLKVGEGSFVDDTTAGTEYQGYRIYRESAKVPHDQYPVDRSAHHDFETTKTEEYRGARGERFAAKAPTDNDLMPKGQFDDRTVAGQDFQIGQADRAEKRVPKDQYPVDHDAKLDSTTMNQEQYTGARGDRYPVKKAESSLRVGDGTFESATTAQADFQGYRSSKATKLVPQDQYPVDHDAQMTFETTKDGDHGELVGDRYTAKRPQDNLAVSTGAFDDRTVKDDDFQFSTGVRTERRIPQDQYPVTQDGSFDSRTMHHQEYQDIKGERHRTKIPEASLRVGEGNFADETTAGAEYQGYGGSRVAAKVPQDQYPVDRSAQHDFETTKSQDHHDLKGERYAARRPVDNDLMPRGDFDSTTIAQQDYQIRSGERVVKQVPKDQYPVDRNAQFDSTTMNQEQYKGAVGDRHELKKAETTLKVGDGEFRSDTTAQADFQGRQVSKAKKIVPQDQYPVDRTAGTDMETTKMKEYSGAAGDRYPATRPHDNIALSSAAFDSRTIANEGFAAAARGERVERRIPQDQFPVAHDSKFDSQTMNQQEYQGLKGDRYQAKKPQESLKVGDGDFNDDTTARTEYQGYRVSKNAAMVPQDQYPVDRSADHTFATTKEEDHREVKGERYVAKRPVDNKLMPEGGFDSTTISQQDYQMGMGDRAERRVPQDQYPVDHEARFDDTTMNKEQFKGMYGDRYKVTKAQSTLKTGEGVFSSATTAQDDFQGQRTQKAKKIVPQDQYPVDRDAQMFMETTKDGEHGALIGDRYPASRPHDNIAISSAAFDSRTVANEDYKYGTGDRVDKIIPKDQYPVPHDAAFDGKTMNLEEYQGTKGDRFAVKKPEESLRVGDGQFTDTTTAGADYQGVRGDRERAKVPSDQYPVDRNAEHSFETTKTADHREHVKGERYSAKRPVDNELMPKGEFDSRTIAQQDYQMGAGERAEKRVPADQYPVDRDAEFHSTTMNQEQYKGEAGERYRVTKTETTLKVGEGAFDSTTTAQIDFQGGRAERTSKYLPQDQYPVDHDAQMILQTTKNEEHPDLVGDRYPAKRPQDNIAVASGAFDSRTVAEQDYQFGVGDRAERRIPKDQYPVASDAAFDGKTMHHEEYQEIKGERFKVKIPQSSLTTGDGEFTDTTTAGADYKANRTGRQRAIIPNDQYPVDHSAQQTFETTKDMDHHDMKGDRYAAKRPVDNQLMPTGDFDSTTIAHQDYQAGKGDRVEKRVPRDQYPVDHDASFDSTTMHQEQYKGIAGDRHQVKKAEATLTVGEGVFDSSTTAQQDFQGRQTSKTTKIIPKDQYPVDHGAHMMLATTNTEEHGELVGDRYAAKRPEDNIALSSGAFDGRTVANEDYKFGIGERVERRVPQDQYPVDRDTHFESTTMHHQEYQHTKGDRYQAQVPQSSLRVGDGEFVDATTASADYQGFQASRQSASVPQDQYPVDHEASRDFGTTKGQEHPDLKGERYATKRPTDNDLMPRGEFDCRTIAQQDFQAGQADRAEKQMPRDQFPVDHDGKFDDTTMNQDQYRGAKGDRYRVIKPESTLRVGDGQFDDSTTAQEDFQGGRGSRVKATVPQDQYPVDHEGRMIMKTTKIEEHHELVGDRYPAKRPEDNIGLTSGTFEGRTVANEDYQFAGAERAEKRVPEDQYPVAHGTSVDYTTMNRQEYQGAKGDRHSTKIPEASLTVGDGQFTDATTAKTEYQGYRVSREQPNVPQDQYPVDHSAKQTFETTKLQEHGDIKGDRYEAKRPVDNELMPKGEFDARTVAQQDYQAGQADRAPKRVPQDQYPVDRDATFDDTTMNKEQYKGAVGDRHATTRPASTLRVGEGSFEGATTAKEDFQGQRGSRMSKVTPQDQYPVDHESGMILETTKTEEHHEAVGDRYPTKKPQDNLTVSGGAFEGRTVASQDFAIGQRERVQRKVPSDQYPVQHDGAFAGSTLHSEEYRTMKGDRFATKIPEGSLKVGEGEFAGDTTNRAEYQSYQVTRRRDEKSTDQTALQANYAEYRGPSAQTEHDGGTQPTAHTLEYSSETDFQGRGREHEASTDQQMVRAENKIPQDQFPVVHGGKFDGMTMQQEQYQAVTGERHAIKKHETTFNIQDGATVVDTTISEESYHLKGDRYPVKKPEDNEVLHSGSFDARTASMYDYGYKEGTGSRAAPNVPSDQYPVNRDGAFDSLTMNRAEYTGGQGERHIGRKLESNLQVGEGSFQDETTARTDFGEYTISREGPMVPEDQYPIDRDGRQSFQTTKTIEYYEARGDRYDPKRPEDHDVMPKGEFSGTTIAKEDYQTKRADRAQKKVPKDEFPVAHGGKFDGTTTYTEEHHILTGGRRRGQQRAESAGTRAKQKGEITNVQKDALAKSVSRTSAKDATTSQQTAEGADAQGIAAGSFSRRTYRKSSKTGGGIAAAHHRGSMDMEKDSMTAGSPDQPEIDAASSIFSRDSLEASTAGSPPAVTGMTTTVRRVVQGSAHSRSVVRTTRETSRTVKMTPCVAPKLIKALDTQDMSPEQYKFAFETKQGHKFFEKLDEKESSSSGTGNVIESTSSQRVVRREGPVVRTQQSSSVVVKQKSSSGSSSAQKQQQPSTSSKQTDKRKQSATKKKELIAD